MPDIAADAVIADKAYDAQERVITPLEKAGKGVVIPSNGRLKQYRAIATRYDKTARNFLGAIHLAAAVVWLN